VSHYFYARFDQREKCPLCGRLVFEGERVGRWRRRIAHAACLESYVPGVTVIPEDVRDHDDPPRGPPAPDQPKPKPRVPRRQVSTEGRDKRHFATAGEVTVRSLESGEVIRVEPPKHGYFRPGHNDKRAKPKPV
jgi:hypothetical protein